jgi:hypothetical protein
MRQATQQAGGERAAELLAELRAQQDRMEGLQRQKEAVDAEAAAAEERLRAEVEAQKELDRHAQDLGARRGGPAGGQERRGAAGRSDCPGAGAAPSPPGTATPLTPTSCPKKVHT